MEFVYVVKRRELFDLHAPHGYAPSHASDEVAPLLERSRTRGFFVERRHAELDAELKQIIPYTLMVRGNEVLLLRRSKKGGDSRLHDKLSIGVGGHINPIDAPDGSLDGVIPRCARREILEELDLATPPKEIRPVGVINDDSNPVGAVHFGIVHVAVLGSVEVKVRETELLRAKFISIDELKRIAADPDSNLESWSRLITRRVEDALA